MSEVPGSIERLRRIAYGPDASPQERAVAEESLRQLEAQERALAAEAAARDESRVEPEQRGGVGSETIENDSTHDSDDSTDDESAEPSLGQRRIRVGWLIPIAVGAVVLGAAGALSGSGQLDRETQAETPAPSATEVPVGIPPGGDLDAADSWFATPFQAFDAAPKISMLQHDGVDEHDVRLAVNGGELGSVWVGRTADKLCLLIADPTDQSSAATCMERDRFLAYGIGLNSNGLSAHWTGGEVVTDPPIGPIPRVAAPGPGNVDAANTWFDTPATAEDIYPISGVLDQMGVNQSQVRLGGHSDSGPKLWVVKQGTTGFCLAGFDASADRGQGQGKGDWNCSTIEEFEAHGVSLSTQNFAAAWNGEMLSMAG